MSSLNINNFKITNRGYVIPVKYIEDDLIEEIKKDLTIEIFQIPGYGSPNSEPEKFYIYRENINETKLYIPRYYGIYKFGSPDKINVTSGLDINCKFNGTLRDYQKNVVKSWIDKTIKKKLSGGIIAIRPGGGKTVIAISLIAKMKKKTLILVHNKDLLTQWISRLTTFLPDARIGSIRGKICNVENKDVVVGMIQSLSNPKKDHEYPEKMFHDFGMLIIDECHHIAAKTFSRCLMKIQPPYLVGLSATPDRDDGLTKVIKYFIGDVCFDDTHIEKTEKEKEYDHIPDALIKIYNYESSDISYCRELLNFQKKPNTTGMITNIVNFKPRNEFILSILSELVEEDRNIVIITERRDHIAYILESIIENKIGTCGPYVGGMKDEILEESKTKQIIVGTYKMLDEAFDCPKLDTLILASPKKKVKQVIGRIMRKEKHLREKIPTVIDIVDDFSSFRNWNKLRCDYYNFKNYKQVEYTVYERKKNENGEILKNIVEHKKDHLWPVPKKKRPKKLPGFKKCHDMSKLVKNVNNNVKTEPKLLYDLSKYIPK